MVRIEQGRSGAGRRRARRRACAASPQSTAIDAAFIDALPKLEIIANFGVGYDSVDARHAGTRGVMVTNTPDVLTEEVADTALGLLINTVRELPRAEQWLRARALGEGRALPADRRDAARPPRRHFRHGPHRARHRQAARSVRAVGRLPQPAAGRGRALCLSSDAGRAGAGGRHADLGGAGRRRDARRPSTPRCWRRSGRTASSSISAAAARSTRRR